MRGQRALPGPGGWRYLHYDVFTDRPLTGNQLAVFTDPTGLTADDMARITRETNFSECTFVSPAGRAGTDVRLHIFGPEGEMPFAGHPVIGSTFALAQEGLVKPGQGRLVLELGLGPTPVDLEWTGDELRFAWMTQRPPEYGRVLGARDAMASALGIERSEIQGGVPIQEVSCGLAFVLVPLATRAAVDRCVLDPRAGEATLAEAGLAGRGLLVFSVEPGGDDAAVYTRMLGQRREDPATGSASGPLGCYLVRHRLAPLGPGMVSRQGVKMGRPSRVHIRIGGTGDEITGVKVGGTSVLVGEGRITRL
jgi:trans-2,3-dihydro-3-hydroxyanthranilate isomerase